MSNNIGSYYDFSGLAALRADAQRDSTDQRTLQQVGEQFESLFYQMMLDSMQKASEPLKSDLLQSEGMDQFQELFHTEVAQAMSKRHALGISDWLARVSRNNGAEG